jgi:hypothetical protein
VGRLTEEQEAEQPQSRPMPNAFRDS